ncbi:MAG: hypothetical protein IKK09_09505 [Clostridia bacterium]|nr:hypothetical protein [Clostridia bacterium]
MFFDYLFEQFGVNEPIMSNEITFENYSKPWIYKQLNALVTEGKLIRFEKGVYYIPTDTVFGKSLLNPRKVIEKKYISDGNNTIGYYSGVTFQNQLRLTTQMSNVIEIYTNNEPSNVRDVYVGNQKVLLRKARTTITDSNVAVLTFLELMNDITPSFLDDERKMIIKNYIKNNSITRKKITEYAPVFPDKVMRNLIESEVIYSVTP